MSIAIEAAEIMEHFQWLTSEEAVQRMTEDKARAEVADELADVLIYCLSFANSSGLDCSQAILQRRRELIAVPGRARPRPPG